MQDQDLIDNLRELKNKVTPEKSVADAKTINDCPVVAITPSDAISRLKEENARYAANAPTMRDFSVRRSSLAKSQMPFVAILSCADSRVAPELAFDQNPGDLFVCRVAGNVVNSDILASLEYAVGFLGVKVILVLGHTHCGAVDASIKVMQYAADLPGYLPDMADAIRPAAQAALDRHGLDNLLHHSIIENVALSARRLAARSAILAESVNRGELAILGAVYHLDTGIVEFLDNR